jgi:TetR/AcrR family transcriptional regulator, mexJK operon transcriptional repressor
MAGTALTEGARTAANTDGAQKRKLGAILRAAADLFVQHGYDHTSMDQIAAAANVARRTIYNQFDSKEALFRAIVADLVEDVIRPLGEAAGSGADVRETLRALARHLLVTVVSPQALAFHRLAVAEAVRFPDIGRAVYEIGVVSGSGKLAAYLAERARLGDLQIPDPQVAAEHFFALVCNHSQFMALLGIEKKLGTKTIDSRADAAVATFLRAFAPASPPSDARRRRSR